MEPEEFQVRFERVMKQIGRRIVGQREVVEHLLVALFSGGNVLLEGVPGLGKTQLVRTLGEVLDLSFSRIQFTPDLMPADIVGTNVLVESPDGRKLFEFQRGPLFAQLILGDEINRATPRTQSAMLEAMQEHTISVGKHTYALEEPFFVLATQNPIEMEGTYRLPEAQLDRFFFKLNVAFPPAEDLVEILHRTTGEAMPAVEKILDATQIGEMQALVRRVPVASHVEERMVHLLYALHPESDTAGESVRKHVRLGPSVRGIQSISLAARVVALTDGRYNVAFEDIGRVALPALRHRLLLNFEGEAEGIQVDALIAEAWEDLR